MATPEEIEVVRQQVPGISPIIAGMAIDANFDVRTIKSLYEQGASTNWSNGWYQGGNGLIRQAIDSQRQSNASRERDQARANAEVKLGVSSPLATSGQPSAQSIFQQLGVSDWDETAQRNTPTGTLYTSKLNPSKEVFVPFPSGVSAQQSGKVTPAQVDWTQLGGPNGDGSSGYGFKYIGGHGDSAQYAGPDGKTYTEAQAKAIVADQINNFDPFQAQKLGIAQTQAGAAATGAAAAMLNAQVNQGQLVLAQTLQPYQIDEILNRIKVANAGVEISWGQLRDSIAKTDILRGQAAVAKDLGYKDLALKTDNQIFTQQATTAGLQLQIANMQSARDALQAQLDQNAMVQNQNNQLAVQKATSEWEQNRQARLQSLAGDIGKLASDPGSRAQLASTLLANSGWGKGNAALARGNQITDESLQPLAQDLGLREDIRSQKSPFTYNPITAPQIAPLNLGNIQLPVPKVPAPVPSMPDPSAATATTAGAATGTSQPTFFGNGMVQATTPTGTQAFYNGAPIAGAWGTAGPAATTSKGQAGGGEGGSGGGMAEGGMTTEEKFIVGDRRDGKPAGTEELIINPTKAPIKVVPNNELPKYFGGTMPQRYADGTDEPTGYALGKYLEQMTLAGRGDEALSFLKSHGYSPTPPPAPETKAPTGMRLPTTVIPVVQMQDPVNPYASDYETPLSYTPPVYNWGEQDMGYVRAPFDVNAVTTQDRPYYYGQAAIDEANRQYAYQEPGQVLPGYSADQRLRAGQDPAFGAGNLSLNALVGASRFLSRLYDSTPVGQRRGFTGFDQYQRPLTPEQRINEMGVSFGGGYIPGYNYPMDVIGLEGYAEGTDYPRYADGTTDGSVFGELPMQDTTEARNFLTKSLQNALSGTPWTAANLPSAVYASTPGTDPVVAQILGSLNAQARGIPTDFFLRQASLLAPAGATQQVTRRSA